MYVLDPCWLYSKAALENTVVDDSFHTGISANVVTVVASCTRPLFECDDDDDDGAVDRLVIDMKEEDTETMSDELQSTVSSVENNACDDIFDKCSLGSAESSVTFEHMKWGIPEVVVTSNSCVTSEPCSQIIDEKPSVDTDKVEKESLSAKAIDTAKPADVLMDEMFIRWPASCGRVGAGLQNLGNTCFVNATMQCLTYTVPLVNYLMNLNHSASCKFNRV